MRRLLLLAAVAAAIGLAMLLAMFAGARADPLVRRATISLPGWPAGARPVRAVLVSDVHIGSPAMDDDRLRRIADQVNALRPDLVLVAGDFIFGHAPGSAERLGASMAEALARVRAPLGIVAVPGNHDHWTGLATVRRQLAAAGVTLVANGAVRRGPLAIGGVDDDFSHHADVPATLRALTPLPGARLLLTHSPDIVPGLPPGAPTLVLAGHTHCAQLVFPLVGPLLEVSRFGARYRCGLVREAARTTVVTAGLGTSGPPLRLSAPPDLWLLTLGP